MISSALSAPEELSLLQRLPFVAFQAFFMGSYMEGAFMYIFCVFIYLLPGLDLVQLLRQISTNMSPSRMTAGRIRALFHLYTCLHLQLDEYNRVYMITLAGSKVLLVLFSVFCTYGAIRLEGMMALSLGWIGFSCTVFLAVMLNSLAEFNTGSRRALLAFRRQSMAVSLGRRGLQNLGAPLDQWMRRKVRATKELRVRIGTVYYIDKPLILTTYQIIIDQTINFLLVN